MKVIGFKSSYFTVQKCYLERKRVEFIKTLEVEKITNKDAKRIFFEYLSLPVQSVCK